MTADESKFKLPRSVERYLAALSKLYAQEGERLLQEIIVNAQTRVHEEWSYDNWNGGTYGHALYLVVPEPLFLSVAKQKADIQDRVRDDLNAIHNVQNEFIEKVFLEMDVPSDSEWRRESGLLVTGNRVVSSDATKRIWGDQGFRLFLGHKSEVKKETADLAQRLSLLGVSSFVAHKDIIPTRAWQDEIENALASMDAFAALMTDDFHDSDWTDQEVGFAFARGVPIIAVRLGRDPYGFIGKFQGLSGDWSTCDIDIVKILLKHDRMVSAFIDALHRCQNWDDGNKLAKVLTGLERLSTQQIDQIVAAYNDNSELRGAFGFNGTKPTYYGGGLLPHLNRLGSRQFRFGREGLIEAAS